MRTFIAYIKISLSNQIQYKIASYAGVIVQFCWAVMNILLYRTFYLSNNNTNMSFQQVVSYMWLQQAFYSLFATWSLDSKILNSIVSGSVCYELCRPMKLYNSWFFQNVARRIGKALPKCIPIILVSSILPGEFRLRWEIKSYEFFAFIISMCLSLVLVVSFCMLIYIIVFFIISPLGIKMILSALLDFMTGAVIPLAFFPEWMNKILAISPFTYMQNIPLQIFCGSIAGFEIIYSLFMQTIWVLIFILVGNILMQKAIKKVIVFGG
ncbi:ABC transporter permease [Lachnoclostridium sp. An169]|uniref:ABC transporter permease n=1 Tax=Lachnoclostridium sp. An169 TaxID=1965569 RepID=UPI000B3AA82C|nr:ABC transporter permease [Lachnoclostridium sp. An169]OUP81255.1 ABC transporter permease [Lachnoclostridium sp. An169]